MPDGRKGNGGARPGAGRRADPVKAELRRVLDAVVPEDTGKQIMDMLTLRARAGDFKAASLVLAYKYGKPTETVEIVDDESDEAPTFDPTLLSTEELDTLEHLLLKATPAAAGDRGEGAP